MAISGPESRRGKRGLWSRYWHAPGIALWLILLLGLLVLSGSSMDNSGRGSLKRDAAQRIVQMTNAIRREYSLAEFSVDSRLTMAAEEYAEVMAQQGWFDHIGPDGSTFDGRAEAAGYLRWAYLGENLARGTGWPDATDVVNGWMNSVGHRENLLSPDLQEIGVGCYVSSNPDRQFWCVQDFGTRRP